MEIKVKIKTAERARRFVNITNKADFDIDLISGNHTYLDAKSLMGILSCDYNQPLRLRIHAGDEEKQSLVNELEDYLAI
ncbi:MAG: HPr family phosphocarrier protein [Agathobacter sp.]|nr:HPr family phosphocarrier protein [Agathobacter sp.]